MCHAGRVTVPAHGLLLAAGAGRRMGTPKGLVRDEDGLPWVTRGVRALLDGGCERVSVVVGAEAQAVETLVPARSGVVDTVYAAAWGEGMSASLRAGLTALANGVEHDREVRTLAVVLLVDLPDVGADVVRRVLSSAGDHDTALVRATYHGRPGHPVVVGQAHWAGMMGELSGDAGARGYLADHGVEMVECGDLATGRDVDRR